MSKLSLKEMIVSSLKDNYPLALAENELASYIRLKYNKYFSGSTISRKCRELAGELRITGTLRKDKNYKEWFLTSVEIASMQAKAMGIY